MDSFKSYKLFVQGASYTLVAYALVGLSGIILLPILTKRLPAAGYASYELVVATVNFLALPLTLGLSYALVRFVALKTSKEEARGDFYAIIVVTVLVNLVASCCFLLGASSIAGVLFSGNLLIAEMLPFVILFASLNVVLLDYFRAFKRLKSYGFFLFAQTYAGLAFTSYFVYAGTGAEGAVLGLLIGQIVVLIAMMMLIVAKIGIKSPRFTHLKAYLSFSVPLVPTTLSYFVINFIDRFLIGIFLGANYVAYYVPSYYLGLAIGLFAAPFAAMAPVILASHFDENELPVVRTVLKHSVKYFLAVALPSTFLFSFLSKPILLLLTTPLIASQGYLVTPFITLSALLLGLQWIFSSVIILAKKTRISLIYWLSGAATNFGLNLFFIPHFGILGAAVTTLIAFSWVFSATVIFSRKFVKFDVNSFFILKSLIASIIMMAVIVQLDLVSKFGVLAATIAGAAAYVVLLVLMKGFDKQELAFVRSLLRDALLR
ncbi:MAG: oligosaccharide flippase family protein [Halobacteriota archaeon]